MKYSNCFLRAAIRLSEIFDKNVKFLTFKWQFSRGSERPCAYNKLSKITTHLIQNLVYFVLHLGNADALLAGLSKENRGQRVC